MRKGKVLLIPFPFTDLSSTKVRPVVVLGSTKLNIVVIFISSRSKKHAHALAVHPTKINGLKTKSVIRCDKIATLSKKIILGEIGLLSKQDITKLNSTLKQFLKLP